MPRLTASQIAAGLRGYGGDFLIETVDSSLIMRQPAALPQTRRASLWVPANGSVLTRLDTRAAQLAHPLKGCGDVVDREVGQGAGVAGPGAALVHSKPQAVPTGLPAPTRASSARGPTRHQRPRQKRQERSGSSAGNSTKGADMCLSRTSGQLDTKPIPRVPRKVQPSPFKADLTAAQWRGSQGRGHRLEATPADWADRLHPAVVMDEQTAKLGEDCVTALGPGE